jgi:hypothetical protein
VSYSQIVGVNDEQLRSGGVAEAFRYGFVLTKHRQYQNQHKQK